VAGRREEKRSLETVQFTSFNKHQQDTSPILGQNIGVKNPHKPVHAIENMAESGVREQETGTIELESPERQDHRCGKMRDGEE
jgi:hypothetical protein